MFRLLPSAGVQVGRCLTVCVQEAKSRALLRTQLDAVGWPLGGQELPDQLNLSVLQHRHASGTSVKLVVPCSKRHKRGTRPCDFTYQLLAVGLGLLSATDLHVHLVACVLQFDLQRSPLRLRFGQPLFARAQFLLGPQPLAAAVVKVLDHLDEVWDGGGGRGRYSGHVTASWEWTSSMYCYWQWANIKRRTINYSLGSMFSLRRSTCVHSLSYRFWRCATVLSMVCFVLWDSVRGIMCALRQQQKRFNMAKSQHFTDLGKHSESFIIWKREKKNVLSNHKFSPPKLNRPTTSDENSNIDVYR